MPINKISVTLACGNVARVVTPEALACEIGVETVRPALLALLLRPDDPQPVPMPASPADLGGRGAVPRLDRNVGSNGTIAGTGTDGSKRSVGTNASEPDKYRSESVSKRSYPDPLEDGSKTSDALAREVARELDDEASLGWYRTVTMALDEIMVRDALVKALRLPTTKLRRSRAAYFTGIVARQVRRAREQQIPAPV